MLRFITEADVGTRSTGAKHPTTIWGQRCCSSVTTLPLVLFMLTGLCILPAIARIDGHPRLTESPHVCPSKPNTWVRSSLATLATLGRLCILKQCKSELTNCAETGERRIRISTRDRLIHIEAGLMHI